MSDFGFKQPDPIELAYDAALKAAYDAGASVIQDFPRLRPANDRMSDACRLLRKARAMEMDRAEKS